MSHHAVVSQESIIEFWFDELSPSQWFEKDEKLDLRIATEFLPTLEAASRCELHQWRASAHGRLAEIIVLDQFSRNVYRNTAQAFRQDALALGLAQEAIALGQDARLGPQERKFLYMPYMHSESRYIHQLAERLFHALNDPISYDYELGHKAIIDRFGRYPHRNEILGRTSTAEELEFLTLPGSSY